MDGACAISLDPNHDGRVTVFSQGRATGGTPLLSLSGQDAPPAVPAYPPPCLCPENTSGDSPQGWGAAPPATAATGTPTAAPRSRATGRMKARGSAHFGTHPLRGTPVPGNGVKPDARSSWPQRRLSRAPRHL